MEDLKMEILENLDYLTGIMVYSKPSEDMLDKLKNYTVDRVCDYLQKESQVASFSHYWFKDSEFFEIYQTGTARTLNNKIELSINFKKLSKNEFKISIY